MREPYYVIAGPTAVGKTAVAIEVAETVDGEIVIADSRQVYRDLDIGTAKPTPAERQRVPHHLIDVVDLGTRYSAGEYARDALAAVDDIQAQGLVAIVCGGTGFYLAALAGALDPIDAQADKGAREEARLRVETIPVENRHALLAEIDPASGRRLHSNDRQRVDRALEVYFMTGAVTGHWGGEGAIRSHRAVCLERSPNELRERISTRLADMLEAGLEDEARRLWRAGLTPDDPGVDTIGYQEWWPYFEGQQSRDRTCAAILTATRQYAKRQATWFRNQGDYEVVPAETGAAGVLARWGEL